MNHVTHLNYLRINCSSIKHLNITKTLTPTLEHRYESQCIGQYDHDGDGGTADVPRVWNGNSCNDATITSQAGCTGSYVVFLLYYSHPSSHSKTTSHSNQTHRYDSDNDGAGHPVFANFATQIDQLEETRDLKATFYDPFRGRYAIPTKSTLGDYYATAGTWCSSAKRVNIVFITDEFERGLEKNSLYHSLIL